MSTIVFQGVQSCIEPQMVETRTLRLKLSSPNTESNGWDFIKCLTNTPQTPKQNESLYVHPMTKNSYSTLNSRSLELCTENLGCETGTNMIENAFFFLPSSDYNVGGNKEREKLRPHRFSKDREKRLGNFPPPLTTMSGSNSLQVRPIREGGRLVIQAVEAPSTHGFFQAERSNGRLILSLFREYDENAFESEVYGNKIENLENDLNYQNKEENIEGIEEEKFEEDCEGVSEDVVNRDMEGNIKEAGVKMGIGKFQKPSRCKEGGLCNWEHFWVATS